MTNKIVMNQYTQQYNAEQQHSSKFDEAAADLTAFLDFSSFDQSIVTTSEDNAQTIALPPLDISTSTSSGSPSFADAFAYTNPSPLRPVDDALLDSPLGLELSPAESFFTTSSISGSPYDLEMSLGDFNGDSSPLFSTVSYDGSPAVTSDLGFPSSSFAGHGSFSTGTPGTIATADLPSLFAALPLVAAHELADIKPMVVQASPPQHNLARHASTESVPFSFEDFIGSTATAQPAQPEPEEDAIVVEESQVMEEEDSPAAASTRSSNKRKSVAEIKREAAALVAEKEFSQDKHLGFRNTKKRMVDYDAPTLPKNYLTESATSKKRSGSTKVAASVAKRSRTSSVQPANLPATQATPLNAEELDEEQLSQIELKRRQNTLAARKSRMRKQETFKLLSDEVEKLRQLNEALMMENKMLKERLGE
ncbi:hypothetical protein JCM5353_006803 [Sporobolomyces roseus]